MIDPIDRMCADPARAQRSALRAILGANEGTAFCRKHGLSATTTLEEYRARVPIRSYEGHRAWIDRMKSGEADVLLAEPIEHWARTSGSTALPKLIPISRSWIRATQIAQTWLLDAIAPTTPVFVISSPPEEGSVTELGLVSLGARYGRIHTPATTSSPDMHYARIAEDIVRTGSRTIIAASPSTLVLVLDALPARELDAIETLACWCSGASSLYLPALRVRATKARIHDVGLSSSEGYFTVSRDGSIAATPIATHHLFELADDNDNILSLDEAKPNQSYRLIVTTPGGLYRYDTEDIVDVRGMRDAMPLLSFSHRAGSVSSIAGEKLTEAQVVAAMVEVSSQLHVVIEDFLAEVEWNDDLPRYLVKVALARHDEASLDHETAARTLDASLSNSNIEYARKRATGRLAMPRVELIPHRDFQALRESHIGHSGSDAQYKLLPLRVRS